MTEFPQTLLGLLVRTATRAKKATLYGYEVYCWRFQGGLSLGRYVFVNENASLVTIKHEYGHCKQSRLLGWLYLPIIGLPSLMWAAMRRIGLCKGVDYYSFYTEKWADRLAGIDRKCRMKEKKGD